MCLQNSILPMTVAQLADSVKRRIRAGGLGLQLYSGWEISLNVKDFA
jgi:hypothetical protein